MSSVSFQSTFALSDWDDPSTQSVLGQWYYRNAQHHLHKAEGIGLLEKAAASGDADAQSLLGSHYDWPPGTEDKAQYWLKKAADQNHGWGCYLLSQYRLDANGKYTAEGIDFLRRGAKAIIGQCPETHVELGRCLAVGEGVEQNKVEAHAWLSVAKAEDWYGWQEPMEMLLPQMTDEEIEKAESLAKEYIVRYRVVYDEFGKLPASE